MLAVESMAAGVVLRSLRRSRATSAAADADEEEDCAVLEVEVVVDW